jgi:hypothetical protein
VNIGAIADAKTGLVPVTFEVKNSNETLRVGIRVDVVIGDLQLIGVGTTD